MATHATDSGSALESCCASAQEPDRLPSASTTMRVTRRRQIQDLRQEIRVLNQRLLAWTENRELQDALDRLLDVSRVAVAHHKQVAQQERAAKECAEAHKSKLRRRIAANSELLERMNQVLKTVRVRVDLPRKLSSRLVSFIPDGDDCRVFPTLRANLDYRESQLDAIFQQCVSRTETAEKTESCIHADGRGVDVRGIGIMPFDVLKVGDTLHRYFQQHAQCRVHGDNDVLLKRNVLRTEVGVAGSDPDHSVPELRGRTVVRRIMHRDQLVLLWESVTEWDSRHEHTSEVAPTRMCHKGWMVVRPYDELGQGVSLAQSADWMHVYDCGGREIQPLDPNMTSALRLLDAFGKTQLQIIDNMLLDGR